MQGLQFFVLLLDKFCAHYLLTIGFLDMFFHCSYLLMVLEVSFIVIVGAKTVRESQECEPNAFS